MVFSGHGTFTKCAHGYYTLLLWFLALFSLDSYFHGLIILSFMLYLV